MKVLFKTAVLALAATLIISVLGAVYFLRNQKSSPKASKTEDHRFTIIEGWTTREIGESLQRQHLDKEADFDIAQKHFDVSKYPLLTSKPKGADLEGYLFPDTYLLANKPSTTPGELSQALIKRALDNFSKKFTPQMQDRAEKLDMSIHQIITLASIIERETGKNTSTLEQKEKLNEERKIISGIFYNRLKADMPLQSDATVNYITGKNMPQATLDDTAIDNPYNTYKYKGLPPGPIANPSLSSIQAALYPEQSDYYYFLHRRDNGEAVFSRTFQEHIRNKAQYLP